jgi:ribosomal-protein-alanine N-acetyltransferase
MSNLPDSASPAPVVGLDLLVHIRPMRLEDLPRVAEIDRLSFSLPWPESSFRYELLENPRSLLRVAEIDQNGTVVQVVGMVVVWLILDEAHIATLAVHPDYRRGGIAREMLVSLFTEIIPQGARLATLEVREGNAAARSLYQRFGFAVVGRRVRYYHDNFEDALIMSIDNLGEDYLAWLERHNWGKGVGA